MTETCSKSCRVIDVTSHSRGVRPSLSCPQSIRPQESTPEPQRWVQWSCRYTVSIRLLYNRPLISNSVSIVPQRSVASQVYPRVLSSSCRHLLAKFHIVREARSDRSMLRRLGDPRRARSASSRSRDQVLEVQGTAFGVPPRADRI